MLYLIAQTTVQQPTTSDLINILINILIEMSKSTVGAIFVLLLVGFAVIYPTLYAEYKRYMADKKVAAQEQYYKELIAKRESELRDAQDLMLKELGDKDDIITELYKTMSARDDIWKEKFESIVEKSLRTTSRIADNLDELNELNKLNKQFLEHMCFTTNKLELEEVDISKDTSSNNGKKKRRDENAQINNK